MLFFDFGDHFGLILVSFWGLGASWHAKRAHGRRKTKSERFGTALGRHTALNPSPPNHEFSFFFCYFFEVFFRVLILIDFVSIPGPPSTSKVMQNRWRVCQNQGFEKQKKTSGFEVDISSMLVSFWRRFGRIFFFYFFCVFVYMRCFNRKLFDFLFASRTS